MLQGSTALFPGEGLHAGVAAAVVAPPCPARLRVGLLCCAAGITPGISRILAAPADGAEVALLLVHAPLEPLLWRKLEIRLNTHSLGWAGHGDLPLQAQFGPD